MAKTKVVRETSKWCRSEDKGQRKGPKGNIQQPYKRNAIER